MTKQEIIEIIENVLAKLKEKEEEPEPACLFTDGPSCPHDVVMKYAVID